MSLLRGLVLGFIRDDPDELQGYYSNDSLLVRKLKAFYIQYEKVTQFIAAVNFSSPTSPKVKFGDCIIYNGLYTRAFKSGIENVVNNFQGILVHLEEVIFVNGKTTEQLEQFSSTPMILLLQDMNDVCFKLNELINRISERRLKGCQILDLCVKYSLSGVSFLNDSIKRILESLHKVFLGHVKCFVMAGVLKDPLNEFFITQDTLTSQECSYKLKCTFIPCHVSHSVASNILDIGKLLKLLRKPPSNDLGIPSLRDETFGVNEAKIKKMFEDFESKSLVNIDELDKVISDIWIILNEHLNKLAHEMGDLLCQQKIVTDIYLMQKGDLIRQFLIRSFHHMASCTFSSMAKEVLNSEFNNAAEDLYLTDFLKYTEHLSFTLPQKNTSKDEEIAIALKLVYKAPWPLHIIFSEEIMQTYNLIFVYLIKLKLTHMKLVNARRELLYLFKVKGSFDLAFILHSKLSHFFTNLENYIFVDVIHYEVNKWEASLNKFQAFDQIKRAHSLFLANVLYKLFLVNDAKAASEERSDQYEWKRTLIQKEIMYIVSLSDSFCQLVEGNPSKQEIINLYKECEEGIIKLTSIVRKISRELHSEHSQSLLFRLDYNDYYSSLILRAK